MPRVVVTHINETEHGVKWKYYHDLFRVRLRECRELRGMTQQELAWAVGFESKVSVTRIENGCASVSIPRLCLIAEVLRVNPSYLLGFSNDMF